MLIFGNSYLFIYFNNKYIFIYFIFIYFHSMPQFTDYIFFTQKTLRNLPSTQRLLMFFFSCKIVNKIEKSRHISIDIEIENVCV